MSSIIRMSTSFNRLKRGAAFLKLEREEIRTPAAHATTSFSPVMVLYTRLCFNVGLNEIQRYRNSNREYY